MENKYRLLLAEDDKTLRDITALFFSKKTDSTVHNKYTSLVYNRIIN